MVKFRDVWQWRNPVFVIIIPIILSPLVILGETNVPKMAYALGIMGFFWVLEVIPISATSLIPIFLFPMLGIMSTGEVCLNYANSTLMLFFGSLVVAVAVERWMLHKRIALRALTLVGPEPRWLMLGIMFPCWFLSMWMSNTATTAMMIPILNAILGQIREGMGASRRSVGDNDDFDEPSNGTLLPMEKVKIRLEMDDMEEAHIIHKEELVVDNRAREEKGSDDEIERQFQQLAKTFALCTAYAANCGGVATITGTPPNIVFKGQVDILYQSYGADSPITFANWLIIGIPISFIVFIFSWIWMQIYALKKRLYRKYGAESPVTFASWLMVGFPISLAVFILTWVWMQIYALRKKCLCCVKDPTSYDSVRTHLKKEYNSLGPMTFAEIVVLANFVILAVLWITRDPQFVPGWGSGFKDKYMTDATAAILIAVVLFVFPAYPPGFRRKTDEIDPRKREIDPEMVGYVPLLTWNEVNEKVAWGILILMGGGFALADGCTKSGLSGWVSDNLTIFKSLPPWLLGSILSYIVALVTNIASNSATATLFLPIVGSLAIKLGINPLYFMIPSTIAASFAYLLPVGTPPNAIVFSTGYLTIKDMFLAGVVINIVSVLLMLFGVYSFGIPAFDLNTLPPEFMTIANTTVGPVPSLTTFAYNVTTAL